MAIGDVSHSSETEAHFFGHGKGLRGKTWRNLKTPSRKGETHGKTPWVSEVLKVYAI